jgi:hypothetical protein
MSRRELLIGLLLFALLAGVVWSRSGRLRLKTQTASLLGFTNGVVGPFVRTFSAMTTNNAQRMQQWLGAGTNGALFRLTNSQTGAISVFPIARFYRKTSGPISDEVPLLNAPTFPGISVKPGEIVTVQVAVLPHQGPWKVSFYCVRHDPGLIESLTALFSGSMRLRGYWVESDWMTP